MCQYPAYFELRSNLDIYLESFTDGVNTLCKTVVVMLRLDARLQLGINVLGNIASILG